MPEIWPKETCHSCVLAKATRRVITPVHRLQSKRLKPLSPRYRPSTCPISRIPKTKARVVTGSSCLQQLETILLRKKPRIRFKMSQLEAETPTSLRHWLSLRALQPFSHTPRILPRTRRNHRRAKFTRCSRRLLGSTKLNSQGSRVLRRADLNWPSKTRITSSNPTSPKTTHHPKRKQLKSPFRNLTFRNWRWLRLLRNREILQHQRERHWQSTLQSP